MLYDTTNTLENSFYLKSKLGKNFVGDNYFIYSLQEKRSREWLYRSNIIDLDEEKEKQIFYCNYEPIYTPIEAAIQTAKSDKGTVLGDNWKMLSFERLDYDSKIGKRYRFSLDFKEFPKMSEKDKKEKASIWITVNKNSNSVGNNIMIRRCNTCLTFVGSKSIQEGKIKIIETHNEPCVLDTNMNYVNIYYNHVLNLPQADCYATLQLNYYTNFIKIGDRYFIGNTNIDDLDNNHVYSVKSVVKFEEDKTTFGNTNNGNTENIPLILLALDKSTISDVDNPETRIADRTTIYKVEDEIPIYNEIILKLKEPYATKILLGEEKKYSCFAYKNNKVMPVKILFTDNFGEPEKSNDYYEFNILGDNEFSVRNKKAYNKSKLIIVCKYESVTLEIPIELGGFY